MRTRNPGSNWWKREESPSLLPPQEEQSFEESESQRDAAAETAGAAATLRSLEKPSAKLRSDSAGCNAATAAGAAAA